ncbi:DPBB and LysM peptidoglycan-binding domain-containing protein [Ferruginibacter sp.]
MKKLLCLLFLVPLFAVAQKVITHTVGPKESLTSIGRMYNINGRELANYNKIDYDKGLTIGQVLKIPVKDGVKIPAAPAKETNAAKTPAPVNETPKTVAAPKESGTPIYHTVAKKETLYHISTLYGKVPVADIKKWNNLTSDGVSEGAKLIVGYKAGPPAKNEADKKPAEKVVETGNETAEKTKPEPKKEEVKPVQKETPPPPVKTVENVVTMKAADFKGGLFKNTYDDQTKGKQQVTETGTGGIFKSTSGWEDGKYYCLHNNAAPGTILKVTNNATGKTVYAKVLDLITDIKQNNGLIIRLSNAAADALGVTDNKLDCTINYSK